MRCVVALDLSLSSLDFDFSKAYFGMVKIDFLIVFFNVC